MLQSQEATRLEEAEAAQKAEDQPGTVKLPPIEELKGLATLKKMAKEAAKMVINAERVLANQAPAINVRPAALD